MEKATALFSSVASTAQSSFASLIGSNTNNNSSSNGDDAQSSNGIGRTSAGQAPVDDGGLVVYSGYLMKRSMWLQEWRKRYVILKQRKICFLKTPADQPHDEVNLKECISIRSADDKTGKANSFEISTPDATYYLYADTEKEKDNWIGAVGKAIVQLSRTYVSPSLFLFIFILNIDVLVCLIAINFTNIQYLDLTLIICFILVHRLIYAYLFIDFR